ncbi:MAG: hypothetical protein RRY79_03890 [Clostridia bacterium]
MNLYELIRDVKTLTIAGMCKNAGKTTVLNACVKALYDHGEFGFALTSIGSDGEEVDIVTATKKPEIYVREDTIIATSVSALRLSDITKEILMTTGVYTAMGEVIVARAKSGGKVVLSGPSTVDSLMKLCEMLCVFGVSRVIIDGAISRKSLSVPKLSDGAILSTGASLSKGLDSVVKKTAYAVNLFSLPGFSGFSDIEKRASPVAINDGEIIEFTHGLDMLIDFPFIKYVRCFGAITGTVAEKFFRFKNMTIVADDPTKIMLSEAMFEKLALKNICFMVEQPIRLVCVTINPFSAYGTGFNATNFENTMKNALAKYNIPVLNVMNEVNKC